MSGKSETAVLLLMKPKYSQGSGDITELVTTEGKVLEDKRGIRGVRAALCRQYAVDYSSLRRKCRDICGPGVTPLLLSPGYTLVPVKTRAAMFTGDPCYGYVNLRGITEVLPVNEDIYKAEIKTNQGISIKSLTAAKTVINNIRRAELLHKWRWPGDELHYQQRHDLLRLLLKLIN